ncbi:NADH dehydrogenase [ubiquinone] 1 beta subcomplex subunit 2, mitochondrial-like [Diprion similis]|uniref:NADH dehydrogenase [ubiquinone] 1 beta subcomplex subunit 2, mitochondrial-like n=1 Tax=Diprion similis TaxID=362088 RepID=UPI001EF8527F|nr:NADH dehydrogenase [ubiquinone] 1 beta subcomplex subunit 2, mitochondrial-like [Diprion similis]
MSTSRGINLLRFVRQVSKINRNHNLQQTRNGHGGVVYRLPAPTPHKKITISTEVVAGIAWWWILWHLWHDYEHITGEFEYPDPSKWTDEELGIPPDDVDV